MSKINLIQDDKNFEAPSLELILQRQRMFFDIMNRTEAKKYTHKLNQKQFGNLLVMNLVTNLYQVKPLGLMGNIFGKSCSPPVP